MKQIVKRALFLTASLVALSSCAKEEFSSIKGQQSGTSSEAITTSSMLCAQSTLISPKVDILMLWDNSSSFNFVNSGTKASMSNLIKSVSEKFDYHIISAPLNTVEGTNSGTLADSQIIVKNNDGLSGDALSYVRSKESAINNLNFPPVSTGSTESGVTRTINMLQSNIANGVFRPGAYTIIVVISNEDEKMCPNNCDSVGSYDNYINPKIAKLLSIRGNSSANPSSGVQLNSAMMRFINISRLTSCSKVPGLVNYMYKKTAKDIYNANYSNGWPTSNDHLSPDSPGFPDSYDLCGRNFNFSNIFDGVNTAIKQTLLLHKYDYWPLASAETKIDPDTVRVVRSDGSILVNRAVDKTTNKGYEIVLDANGEIKNYTQNTRYYPTAGEPFTGKLIKLYGTEKNDKVIYPDCLTVTFTEPKATYGYIYLDKGRPEVSTISVMINGNVIPQDSSNGWTYLENGPQFTNGTEPDLEKFKAFGLPAGISSGFFLKLNGSAKVQNSTSNVFDIRYNPSTN